MYRKAKRDANEPGLVKYLRRLGCSVVYLDDPGVPDLLVGWFKSTILIEVKNEKGTLTKPQKDFFEMWQGQCDIVRSIKDIKELFRKLFMPIRTYACETCGQFDKIQKWSDLPLTECPTCGKVLEEKKIYSLAGIIYKGEGWYGTDTKSNDT